jgi:hypothetical protein
MPTPASGCLARWERRQGGPRALVDTGLAQTLPSAKGTAETCRAVGEWGPHFFTPAHCRGPLYWWALCDKRGAYNSQVVRLKTSWR